MAAITKDAFIRRQMKGKHRSRAQAEADWKLSRRRKKKNPSRKKKSGSPAKRTAKKRTSSTRKKSNPSSIGSVPVLLMNPGGKRTMAKRKRRRKPSRKKTTRRRRRNPSKGGWDLLGTGIAMLGGAGVAGATFLLDGTSVKLDYQNIGVLLGSAGLGLALAKHAPSLGKGIAGAGLGIGGLGLLRSHVMPPLGDSRVTREKGEETTTAAVRAKLGRSTRALMMNAVKAQLGCTRTGSCDRCRNFNNCRMSELMNLRSVRANLPPARATRGVAAAPSRREWSTAMGGMI